MNEDSANKKGSAGDSFDVSQTGDRSIAGKEITIVEGNVYKFASASPEAIEQFRKIVAMPTEVPPGQAAGLEGSKTPQDVESLRRSVDEVLELLRASRKPGQAPGEIQAGEVRLSRVDLLLKKAVLLTAEADQMVFDHLQRHKREIDQAKAKGARGVFEMDQKKLLAGFDETARTAKFKEAYALLLEANELDPTNTEVLLHMAQVLIVLTPDDPSDEQRILYRIRALISAPKDDAERFRLAQATFLLATHTDQLDVNTLSDARAMFEKLGRTEWVRHCDDLLRAGAQLAQQRSTSPGPQPAAPYAPQPSAPYTAQPAPMPPQPQAGFQPVGQWQIHVSDALGSIMHLQLYPNGTFQCTQQAGPYGLTVQATGQWLFNPYNRLLQFQGLVNGFQPFMLGIAIQSQQGNQYYGVGSDGYSYLFSRA